MTHPVLETLFPDRSVLYYEAYIKDQRFIRQWTRIERADDKGYVLGLYLEIDPRPLGQGGSITKERCRLVLDRDLSPVGYGSEAAGARVGVHIEGGKAHVMMHDGTRHEVDFGGAQFIVEANMAGLDALMFAVAHARRQLDTEVKLDLFLLNKLLVVPYTITRVDDRELRTSYDEVVRLDERGVLESTEVPKAAIQFRRLAAPPLPAWHAEPKGTHPSDVVRYVPPKDRTFELRDVSVATPRGEVGGTLTIPRGQGPFPAVLFLSGTGTHDRHGLAGNVDIGSHEVVDHASEHGFVGLRFDTRGAGTTKLTDLDAGLGPLLDDAEAWFRYLAQRSDVDPKRIAIVGHSQGGTLALVLATSGRVTPTAVALLATPGRPLHALLLDQVDWKSRELGLSDEQRATQAAELRELLDAVKAGKAFEPGAVPDRLVADARAVAWFKDHLEIDPTQLAAKLPCRLLVAQGERDFQVPLADAERLFRAAKDGGVDAELATFGDLDHLFKPCGGKASTLELYYDTSRRVDPAFLARLTSWLDR